MIQKYTPATYASELLVDMAHNERRQWVRQGYEDFWRYVAEDCILDLQSSALCRDSETVRQCSFRLADRWLNKTDEGRAFLELVKDEMGAKA